MSKKDKKGSFFSFFSSKKSKPKYEEMETTDNNNYSEDDGYEEYEEYVDGEGESEIIEGDEFTEEEYSEELMINLIDNGCEIIAQAVVPGLSDEDIEIEITREKINITTATNSHIFDKKGDYLYEEIGFGTYYKSLLLPSEIDIDNSKAECADGVLTITMPKIDKNNKKKLSIKKK